MFIVSPPGIHISLGIARKRGRIPWEQKFLSYMAFSVHEVVLSLKRTARLTSDANDFVNAKSHAREQERKTSARRVEEGRPYNKKQENKTTAGSGYTRLNSGDVLLLLSLRCSSLDVTQCSPERGGALRDIQKTAERETSVAGAGLGSFLVIFFTER